MKYTAGRTNSAFIQRVGVNKKTYIRAIPNDRGCIFFFPRRFYHVKNNISNKKVSKRLEMIFFLWNFSFSTVQFFSACVYFSYESPNNTTEKNDKYILSIGARKFVLFNVCYTGKRAK